MKISKFIFIITFLLLSTKDVLSCDLSSGGILPGNNWKYAVSSKAGTQLSEQDAKDMLDKISLIYRPIVRAFGGELEMKMTWNNDEFNAFASRKGSKYLVEILGGLIRHPKMNQDSLAMVTCHELGHHIGGAPLKRSFFHGTRVHPSNEGQSDYFAGLKCFKEVFKNENNFSALQGKSIPGELKEACFNSYGSSSEYYLCLRSGLAGLRLGSILSKGGRPVSLKTPDVSVVSRTLSSHPAGQCRADTYLAGSLCTKDEDLSFTNPNKGTCHRGERGPSIGARPLCWYRPRT